MCAVCALHFLSAKVPGRLPRRCPPCHAGGNGGTQKEGLVSRRAELVARIKDDLGGAMSAELEATILRGACTAQRAAAGRRAGCVPAGGWQRIKGTPLAQARDRRLHPAPIAGVAFHHAGLTSQERAGVEAGYRDGCLQASGHPPRAAWPPRHGLPVAGLAKGLGISKGLAVHHVGHHRDEHAGSRGQPAGWARHPAQPAAGHRPRHAQHVPAGAVPAVSLHAVPSRLLAQLQCSRTARRPLWQDGPVLATQELPGKGGTHLSNGCCRADGRAGREDRALCSGRELPPGAG